MFADFSPKKPGRGCCDLTAEECELAERARDAETERMENADSEGHLRASNNNIKRFWKP